MRRSSRLPNQIPKKPEWHFDLGLLLGLWIQSFQFGHLSLFEFDFPGVPYDDPAIVFSPYIQLSLCYSRVPSNSEVQCPLIRQVHLKDQWPESQNRRLIASAFQFESSFLEIFQGSSFHLTSLWSDVCKKDLWLLWSLVVMECELKASVLLTALMQPLIVTRLFPRKKNYNSECGFLIISLPSLDRMANINVWIGLVPAYWLFGMKARFPNLSFMHSPWISNAQLAGRSHFNFCIPKPAFPAWRTIYRQTVSKGFHKRVILSLSMSFQMTGSLIKIVAQPSKKQSIPQWF